MAILSNLRRALSSFGQSRPSKQRRPRLLVETLEERSLMSVSVHPVSGSLNNIVFDGAGANDTYFVRLSSDGKNLQVWENIPTTNTPFSTPLASVNKLIVNGHRGNDTLTVDFSNGDPMPAGGLEYNGADRILGFFPPLESNHLNLQGGSFLSETHTVTGDSSGTISFGKVQLLPATPPVLSYSGVHTINDTVPLDLLPPLFKTSMTYIVSAAAQKFLLSDVLQSPTQTQISGFGATVNFANKSHLIFDATGGGDTITVNAKADSALFLTINASAGQSVVNVQKANALEVNTSGDNNTIHVERLTALGGPAPVGQLTVHGQSGNDTLNVDDEAFFSEGVLPYTYVLTDNTLSSSHAGSLTYDGMGSLNLQVHGATATFVVESVSPTTPIDIQGVPSFNVTPDLVIYNTLEGPNVSDTWQITSVNSGSLSAGVTFTNMGNLTGGSATDRFAFASNGSITGGIAGGSDDWLDYSNAMSPLGAQLHLGIHVDLGLGTADRVGYHVQGVENVRGSTGFDTLLGDTRPNILVGGAGNDRLEGRGGTDILIGGNGQDTLIAGSETILIGGTTAFDANDVALTALMDVWSDRHLTFDSRVAALQHGAGPFGAFRLDPTTVHDDHASNSLQTSALNTPDWIFLGNADSTDGNHQTDTFTNLF
jgi:hypothetical protein